MSKKRKLIKREETISKLATLQSRKAFRDVYKEIDNLEEKVENGVGGIASIQTSNTGNVKFTGDGTAENPLKAEANVDVNIDSISTTQTAEQLNALADGLYFANGAGVYNISISNPTTGVTVTDGKTTVDSGYSVSFTKKGSVWSLASSVNIKTNESIEPEFITKDYTSKIVNIGTINAVTGAINTSTTGYSYSDLIEVKQGEIILFGFNNSPSTSSSSAVLVEYDNNTEIRVGTIKKMTDYTAGIYTTDEYTALKDMKIRFSTGDANSNGIPFLKIKSVNPNYDSNNNGGNGNISNIIHDTPYNNYPLPFNATELKILILGNSFTRDSVELLPSLCNSFDSIRNKITIGRTMKNSENLQGQVENYDSNNPVYDFVLSSKGGSFTTESNKTIKYALEYTDWDIIILQQQSLLSGLISSYKPYLKDLNKRSRYSSKKTNVNILFNLTWAVSEKGNGQDYLNQNYQGSQLYMYNKLKEVYSELQNMGINLVIPIYQAFQNARNTPNLKSVIDDLTVSDGFHTNIYGKYLGAGCLFQQLIAPCYGLNIRDLTYVNDTIGKTNQDLLTECVINSVLSPCDFVTFS